MNWDRMKNYGLWVSIFAFIPLLLKGFGVNVLPENYSEITTALLSILVMAGILSNPTTENKWFLDDPNKKDENPTDEPKQ